MDLKDKVIIMTCKASLVTKVYHETGKIYYAVQLTMNAHGYRSMAYLKGDAGTTASPEDASFYNKEVAEQLVKLNTYTIYKEKDGTST